MTLRKLDPLHLKSLSPAIETGAQPVPATMPFTKAHRSGDVTVILILDALRQWLRRSNERHELVLLNERQLRDIGLDRDFVRSQAAKPFWHQ